MAPACESAILSQPLEFFRRVNVDEHVRIVHREICDVLLRRVLNVTRGRVLRRAQETLDHLPARDEGMSVLAFELRHNCPGAAFDRFEKMFFDRPHCRKARSRTVYESDDRSIAAAVQNLLQPDL